MVLQTTIIEAEIKGKVDKQSFNAAKKEVEKVGKQLDNVLEPEIKLAKLKQQLGDVNKQIRAAKKAGDRDGEILLRINAKRISQDISKVNKQLNKLKGVGGGLTRLFQKTGAVIAGAFAARAAISGISNLVNSFSDATSTIIKETGATGDALKGLQADFNAVFSQVPQSAQEVGQAIGDVNTRFGVTGTELQTLTKDFLDFSRVTGTDVSTSIRTVSRLAQDFGLSIEQTPSLLDKLTVASQETGISVQKLGTLATNFGTQFRALGFGLDESIALLSKFEAAGVNSEAILAGLNKGVNELAKETGTTIPEAFQAFTDSIENAGSESEALAIAADVLGSRAGPQLALAVREGKLEFQDFIGVLNNADGALARTAEASLTTAEQIKVSFNNLSSSLQPTLDFLGGFVSGFFQATADFVNLFGESAEQTKGSLDVLGGSLDDNNTKIIELTQSYQSGQVSVEEYNEQLKDLEGTNKSLGDEFVGQQGVLEELTAGYEAAWAQAGLNNDRVAELTNTIAENNAAVEAGTLSIEDAAEANRAAQLEIDKLNLATQQLSLTETAFTVTQEDVNSAVDALSTATGVAEFDRLKQSALDTIQALIIAQQAVLSFESAQATGLVSTKAFEAQKTLIDLQGQFNKLQFANFESFQTPSITTGGGGGGVTTPSGGGAGGKSEATIAAEQEAKDLLKIEEDAAKERARIEKESAKITEESFKTAFDAIGDAIKDREKDIEDFAKSIEDSTKKIKELNKEIDDIGKEAGEGLASRAIEIKEALKEEDGKLSFFDKKALNEELDLINANTTAAERLEAVRQEGLSDAEKIIEERDAAISGKEEEKSLEEEKREKLLQLTVDQTKAIDDLRKFESFLSEKAATEAEIEFGRKKAAADEYKQTLEDIIALSTTAGLGGTSISPGGAPLAGGGGGGTVINEGGTEVSLTIQGVIDQALVDTILDEAALRIQDAQRTREGQ